MNSLYCLIFTISLILHPFILRVHVCSHNKYLIPVMIKGVSLFKSFDCQTPFWYWFLSFDCSREPLCWKCVNEHDCRKQTCLDTKIEIFMVHKGAILFIHTFNEHNFSINPNKLFKQQPRRAFLVWNWFVEVQNYFSFTRCEYF